MSDTILDLNKIIDKYEEHINHIKYDRQCSTCYNIRQNEIDRDNNRNLDLMSERSAHPEESYW